MLFKNIMSDDERNRYIYTLTNELPFLRAKANISQDKLANMVGISRQTYGALERKERVMGWDTYLSLIFFFDNNKATHQTIRKSDAFPHSFIEQLSGNTAAPDKIISALSDEYEDIFGKLDEQALHSIRTMIMIEYARCTNQSGEAVVKSFDGMNFMKAPPKAAVSNAIRKIRSESGGE